jgi:hypothetical protein
MSTNNKLPVGPVLYAASGHYTAAGCALPLSSWSAALRTPTKAPRFTQIVLARNTRLWSILRLKHPGLPGCGYADFHASANFAMTEFYEVRDDKPHSSNSINHAFE